MPDVVSTSEKTGKLRQKTEEKRRTLFKIGFIINPKLIRQKVNDILYLLNGNKIEIE